MNNHLQSFLFAANAAFIEELRNKYIQDPNSVEQGWQSYFQDLDKTEGTIRIQPPNWGKIRPKIIGAVSAEEIAMQKALDKKAGVDKKNKSEHNDLVTSQNQAVDFVRYADMLSAHIIKSYRDRGHFLCKLDPLGLEISSTKDQAGLDLQALNVLDSVLDYRVNFHNKQIAISELISSLDQIYTQNIGLECSHIHDKDEHKWICEKFEHISFVKLDYETQKYALNLLSKIEGFEQYIHVKFPGAKRFSCEGNESAVLATDFVIQQAAKFGVNDVVIGMAHRGRLATLTTIVQKPYKAIMSEFTGASAFPLKYDIAGDVKYHMGWNANADYFGKNVHISLLPNPSHLESVNPVVAGVVRSKQDKLSIKDRKSVLGLLIHGDAAFCGQGVVAECLNMSGISSYQTCGIIHVVTNNQIGYTATPTDGHPGRYSTEFAKVCNAPIVHVNANNILDVLKSIMFAVEYRQQFGKDVVIDIVGYRKYGHNEGDEPAYTQGVMYEMIRKQKSIQHLYADQLISSGIISPDFHEQMQLDIKNTLDTHYAESKEYKPAFDISYGVWSELKKCDDLINQKIRTGVKASDLKNFAKKISEYPDDFAIHPKLGKIIEQRYIEFNNNVVDWSMGEAIAFASVLNDGVNIRMTGQDAGRGTFAHRHSVLHDQKNNNLYVPLNSISDKASYFVADSSLSEFAILGFEYGYSIGDPKTLTIWEAQFGDFVNGAQTIIDQYISSAETKWLQMSGLVMLLPHGYEGQGPEHSSARLERFLQLAAENNMFIANPTTPASLFHLLRRQILANFRKPLIVMTPKSLLRHKLAVSKVEDLSEKSQFIPILEDKVAVQKDVKTAIMCTGKVYYDLYEHREKHDIKDVAIIRIEQLYPFDTKLAGDILSCYKNVNKVVWCQEEPENMGAWNFIEGYINSALNDIGKKLLVQCVSRPSAASPAVGYLSVHTKQQQNVVLSAFNQ